MIVSENESVVLVYTTFPDMAAAKRIGGELVDRGLAACINILPGMVSIYIWENARETSEEVVVIFKTRHARTNELIAEIERQHPYDTPAILTFEASGGAKSYLEWICEMTKGAE